MNCHRQTKKVTLYSPDTQVTLLVVTYIYQVTFADTRIILTIHQIDENATTFKDNQKEKEGTTELRDLRTLNEQLLLPEYSDNI